MLKKFQSSECFVTNKNFIPDGPFQVNIVLDPLEMSGFKTRNEWFRASIIERKKALQKLKKIEVEGLEEKDIEEIVNRWRSEKNK